jgi:hypothetical protein
MRTRTLFWVPFLLSVGTISWGLLLSGLVLLAAVIVTPAMRDVKAAEATRNEYQATLKLLEQQIALQKEFSQAASTDPVLMERLAARELNLNRRDQETLILDPNMLNQDRSIKALLSESLKPVAAVKPAPLNYLLAMTMNPALRPLLIMLACTGIFLSFFLGVKYERSYQAPKA